MIPRKYYHEDRDELSTYINASLINERLFEGYLQVKNTYSEGGKIPHPLIVFNEAYYYASKVVWDEYPELYLNEEFMDECLNRYNHELSRDVIFTFVYVILSCMKDKPKKVQRFITLVWQKVELGSQYLEEIVAAGNGRISERGYTDGWLRPEIVGDPFINYDEVDWYEATDGFNWFYIKEYMDAGWNLRDKKQIAENILAKYLDAVDNGQVKKSDIIPYSINSYIREYDNDIEELRDTDPEAYLKMFPEKKEEYYKNLRELPDIPPLLESDEVPADDNIQSEASTEDEGMLSYENLLHEYEFTITGQAEEIKALKDENKQLKGNSEKADKVSKAEIESLKKQWELYTC